MKLFVGAKAVVEYGGKILLLRESAQYDEGTEAGKWDVPGGRIEPEESLAAGFKREVKEESGLDVVPGKLLGAFDNFPEIKGETCHIVRVYFACSTDTDQVTLSDDHDQYEWVNPTDLTDKILVSDLYPVVEEFIRIRSMG